MSLNIDKFAINKLELKLNTFLGGSAFKRCDVELNVFQDDLLACACVCIMLY